MLNKGANAEEIRNLRIELEGVEVAYRFDNYFRINLSMP